MARTKKTVAEEVKVEEVKAVEAAPAVEAPVEAPAEAPVEAPAEAPKAEKKAPAKKAAAKKAAAPKAKAEKKEAAPKAEKKAPAKKAEKKEAAPKAEKAPAKKAAAKKADAKVNLFIQYAGAEVSYAELVEKAKAAAGVKSAKTVNLYVKPEENMVYYVVDEDNVGGFELA